MAVEHPQVMTVEEYFQLEENEEITLSSLGVHFPLADAYIDVEFGDTQGTF